MRNTKSFRLSIFKKFNCEIQVSDICADKNESEKKYDIQLVDLNNISKQDVLIIAVGHSQYKSLSKVELEKMLNPNGIVIDVKSIYDKEMFDESFITHWRL